MDLSLPKLAEHHHMSSKAICQEPEKDYDEYRYNADVKGPHDRWYVGGRLDQYTVVE